MVLLRAIKTQLYKSFDFSVFLIKVLFLFTKDCSPIVKVYGNESKAVQENNLRDSIIRQEPNVKSESKKRVTEEPNLESSIKSDGELASSDHILKGILTFHIHQLFLCSKYLSVS